MKGGNSRLWGLKDRSGGWGGGEGEALQFNNSTGIMHHVMLHIISDIGTAELYPCNCFIHMLHNEYNYAINLDAKFITPLSFLNILSSTSRHLQH